MVSYIPAVTFCHHSVICRVLCRSFPLFRCTPEDCVDLGASPDERNDSVDLVSCFGKSRIRLRMLWRCLGVDELADIREEHRIADCGDSGIPGAETHVPLRYAENRMDGILIHAFVCLCTFFYCLEYLPVLDFRPYKIGADIKAGMEIPEGAKPSVFESRFVLEKDGRQQEFTLDNYPDSTWTFVETRTVLKEKGYEPPIHDFSMISLGTGEDITDSVLTDKGYTFLLVAHRIEEADDSNIDLINEIYDYSVEHGYGFYALTSSPDEEIEMWRERTGAEYPFCQMDDITLKTIIRSNPGLLLIKDGTILNKWSDNQLPDEYVLNDSLDKLELGQQKQENKLHTIGYVLLWFIVPLTLVVGIDILIIKRRERKSRERQAAQSSDNRENDKL